MAEARCVGQSLQHVFEISVRIDAILPAWALQKLEDATAEQLESWSERIFDTQNLEAFFE